MKKLLLAALISVSLMANTVDSVFLKSTPLTTELKNEILAELNKSLLSLKDTDYTLQEVQTIVRLDEIDQGIVDQYFTTKFELKYQDSEGQKELLLIVKSAQYDGSNPQIKWTEIFSINTL